MLPSPKLYLEIFFIFWWKFWKNCSFKQLELHYTNRNTSWFGCVSPAKLITMIYQTWCANYLYYIEVSFDFLSYILIYCLQKIIHHIIQANIETSASHVCQLMHSCRIHTDWTINIPEKRFINKSKVSVYYDMGTYVHFYIKFVLQG